MAHFAPPLDPPLIGRAIPGLLGSVFSNHNHRILKARVRAPRGGGG
jgi:hypothetical protein